MSKHKTFDSIARVKSWVKANNLPSTGTIMSNKKYLLEEMLIQFNAKGFLQDLIGNFLRQDSAHTDKSRLLTKLSNSNEHTEQKESKFKKYFSSLFKNEIRVVNDGINVLTNQVPLLTPILTNAISQQSLEVLLTSLWNTSVWNNIFKQFTQDAHRQSFIIDTKQYNFVKALDVVKAINNYIATLPWEVQASIEAFEEKYSKEQYRRLHNIDTSIEDIPCKAMNANMLLEGNIAKLMKESISTDNPFGDNDNIQVENSELNYTKPDSLLVRLIIMMSQQSVLAIPMDIFSMQYSNINTDSVPMNSNELEITKFMTYWMDYQHELSDKVKSVDSECNKDNQASDEYDMITSHDYIAPSIIIGESRTNKKSMTIRVESNAEGLPILKISKQFRVFALDTEGTQTTLLYINCQVNVDLLHIARDPIEISWSINKG